MDMILLSLAMAVTVEGLIEYIKTLGKAVLAKMPVSSWPTHGSAKVTPSAA